MELDCPHRHVFQNAAREIQTRLEYELVKIPDWHPVVCTDHLPSRAEDNIKHGILQRKLEELRSLRMGC